MAMRACCPAQGRARFQLYQKLLALAAALIQAVGQLTYIRPFVPEWDGTWLAVNSLTLVAGAMTLVYVSGALRCQHAAVPMKAPGSAACPYMQSAGSGVVTLHRPPSSGFVCTSLGCLHRQVLLA